MLTKKATPAGGVSSMSEEMSHQSKGHTYCSHGNAARGR